MEVMPEFYEAVNAFLSEYKLFIGGFLGFVTVACLGFLVLNFMALGTSNSFSTFSSDRKREKAIKGLLIAGVSLALLGTIDLVYFLVLNTIIL